MNTGQGRLHLNDKIENTIKRVIAQYPNWLRGFEIYLYDRQPRTRETYLENVLNFLNYIAEKNKIKIDDIKEQDLQNVSVNDLKIYFKNQSIVVKKGQPVPSSGSFRKLRWTSVNTLFDYLVLENIVNKNLCVYTKRPNYKDKPEFNCLEEDEIRAVVHNIKITMRNSNNGRGLINRDILLIQLDLETGIRASALISIMLQDVDLKNKKLTVVDKGEKIFHFDLSNDLVNSIKRWLIDREQIMDGEKSDFLFITHRKKPLSYAAVYKLINKYSNNVGHRISPHKLRSTYAKMVYDTNKDIVLLQGMMQHASIDTTRRYVSGIKDINEKKQQEAKRQIIKALYQRTTI